jgi:hypothetical protein
LRRPKRIGGEAGSVLVEAMVACAILAMTLALACRAVGDGAHRTGGAERSRLAMLEARSRLDEVGADIALAPGVSSGEDGELVWRVEIAPADSSGAANGRLMDVRVGVEQGGRQVVSLHSLRLAPPPEPDARPDA